MASTSVTGVSSGMDWDSLITKTLEKSKKPAYVVMDKKDKLENKKSYLEELKISMQTLQSSLNPLKLSSTYSAKEIEVSRIDSNASAKGVLTASVNAEAEVGLHTIEVLRLAKSQVQRSNSLTTPFAGLFTGPLNGLSQTSFQITAEGKKFTIGVGSTDTIQSLADRINNTLKTANPPVAVTASVVDNRLILKSDRTGLGEAAKNVEVTRSFNRTDDPGFFIDSAALKDGDLKVTSTDGSKTWKHGVDFDIVGGQISWRNYEPTVVPAAAKYKVTYNAVAGDAYANSATRGTGDVDTAVLPFTPGDNTRVTIRDNSETITYVMGTDYDLQGGNVCWLPGAHGRPAQGDSYKVSYAVPPVGEAFTLNISRNDSDVITPSNYAEYVGGKAVITQGLKTWEQGVDFDIVRNGTGTEAVVKWRPEAGWDAPLPASNYSIELTKADGTVNPLVTVERSSTDTITLSEHGFTTATGSLGGTAVYNYKSNMPADNITFGNPIFTQDPTGTPGVFTATWAAPAAAGVARTGLPAPGEKYKVEYNFNQNTFSLSDNGGGILAALGLNLKDTDHYTAAVDAELTIDGEPITCSSNKLNPDLKNELFKGTTIELKGLGTVSLDIAHNAEPAVKAVQAFVESYNDNIKWINTKAAEKALDESKKATLKSDDFRMKWGVLAGSQLLKDTKNSMRYTTGQSYLLPFKERKSADAIYGTMAQNGLQGQEILRVTVGARNADIVITPEDTLESIAAKINDPDGGGQPLNYDSNGNKYPTPFANASVSDNKLVIRAGTDRPVTLSGQRALRVLDLNYSYTVMAQLGITSTKTDFGKSGELEFDTQAFMKAITENPEDAKLLMTSFAESMQKFMDKTIKASGGEAGGGGSISREISAIDTEVRSLDKYLAEFERRLKAKQESLVAQFSKAETSLAKMMQQSSWLASVTSQLQNNSSSSSKQS